ncbi:hypothetical protein MILUP08_41798 [Micromonospora lupini str. Lupac 08]|uniref:Uncharacterized protein n=1 Tax=Micromonospora lupini str. Lupac 08 TaxID=1150864 RepID=I0KZ84_9ACTN|nr:hypothetical protein MILUP08_41798 [Micromonospora lupini str. Lupac 08]
MRTLAEPVNDCQLGVRVGAFLPPGRGRGPVPGRAEATCRRLPRELDWFSIDFPPSHSGITR